MKEIEEDGLVHIGLSSVDVTESGRPFIRNICMALDARMYQHQRKEVQFSKVI